ncbi:MAG TPA: DUF2442 domain-containing protein [Acetobacteraceae bacterium]|nr:DUF2442 domain-containing protein [Acetobacteraceae bacterium]
MSQEVFSRYDSVGYLKTEEDIAAYLEAAAVEGGDDPAFLARSLSVVARARATVPWRVRDVTALPGYRLAVTFLDGTAGTVDMSEMIKSEAAGVFATLRDPELFAAVTVELGAVTWPNGLDLAPDAMHEEILAHGEWRLL